MKKLKKISLASFLISIILILSSATVHAVEVTATITLENPGGYYGIAYDSGKGEIFVTNYNSSSVSIISDSTNLIVATVNVGVNPIGLAYDSGNGQIFVANYNSSSVSVISDSTNTVIANVTLENQPQGIGYDSGKGEIFVTYSESNRVSVISDSSVPEYPSFIVVSFLMVTIVLTALIYRGKHQIETRIRKQR